MDMSNAPREYRLGSAPMLSAPGLVRWTINGYAFKRDRKAMLKVITECWDIPEGAAKALLSKSVSYTVDGDTVVFTA